MEDYNKLYQLLESRGFKEIDKEGDSNENNYYHLFTDGVCEIRVSRPFTFPTIDIRKISPHSVWHDIALIKSYLSQEKRLSYHVTMKEYMEFIEVEIDRVKGLFETGNYLKMQRELDLLLKKRTKQFIENNKGGNSFD